MPDLTITLDELAPMLGVAPGRAARDLARRLILRHAFPAWLPGRPFVWSRLHVQAWVDGRLAMPPAANDVGDLFADAAARLLARRAGP